jgi:hypothetical protein
LTAEGFVIFDPQRGARVADFNSRELNEIYEVWIALESLAAERAAERMTQEAAQRIRVILDKMDAEDISPMQWVCLNWGFHDSLYACADEEFLRKAVSNLRRSVEPYLPWTSRRSPIIGQAGVSIVGSSRRACDTMARRPRVMPRLIWRGPRKGSSSTCAVTGSSCEGEWKKLPKAQAACRRTGHPEEFEGSSSLPSR